MKKRLFWLVTVVAVFSFFSKAAEANPWTITAVGQYLPRPSRTKMVYLDLLVHPSSGTAKRNHHH